ncbi:inovirus-type Gp2 protein, partial [uncultured Vibrio sp.]|uniref:YagK/YfjJ domain-containing protein n=2 Tax=uncultured Vibrio sp. TaxID=114054 RepID=UPI002623E526
MNMFQFAQIPAKYGSLNQRYLVRINDTVMGALAIHPRALLARIDLRIPNNGLNSDNPLERDVPTCYVNTDVDLMKRFIASLKVQMNFDQRNKAKQGKRIHPPSGRIVVTVKIYPAWAVMSEPCLVFQQ